MGCRADNPSGPRRMLEVGASGDQVSVLDCIGRSVVVEIVGEQQIAASLHERQPFGVERLRACWVKPLTGRDVHKQTLTQQVVRHRAAAPVPDSPGAWNPIGGILLREEGNPEGSQAMLEDSVRSARRAGDRFHGAYAYLGLAFVAADAGNPQPAAELHGAAQAFSDQLGIPWLWFGRLRQASIGAIRARLGEKDFQHAYEKGGCAQLRRRL
jgi:hypothetical protein